MKRSVLFLICGLLFVSTSAYAQGFAKAGTAGFQSLKLGVGAKATAMGESFVAIADDPSALYWNPSGLARQKGIGVLAAYTKWPAEINWSTLGAVYNSTSFGAVGISISTLNTGYMNVRDVYRPEGTGDVFTASDFVAGLSFARNLTDRFSFGLTAKIVREDLGEGDIPSAKLRDTGVAFDVGTLYNIGLRDLKLGISILNFGPNLHFKVDQDQDSKYDEDPENLLDDDKDGKVDEDGPEADVPLPLMFRIGLAMSVYNNGANSFITSIEATHPNDNLETLNLGAQYSFNNMLFLRGGYRINTDLKGWTAGVGFKIANVSIDYAYNDLDFLDKAQRASISLSF